MIRLFAALAAACALAAPSAADSPVTIIHAGTLIAAPGATQTRAPPPPSL